MTVYTHQSGGQAQNYTTTRLEKTVLSTDQQEAEYYQTRQRAQEAHVKLQQEQMSLSNEKALNSELRAQIQRSPGRHPHQTMRVGAVVMERQDPETSALEQRLYQLSMEIEAQRGNYNQTTDLLSQRETLLEESEARHFLQKNEVQELQHLGRMANIFEQENRLLAGLCDSSIAPSATDIEKIKQNIVDVRAEIDGILKARGLLNQRFEEVVAESLRLKKENAILRQLQTREEDLRHIESLGREIVIRNQKIKELTAQLQGGGAIPTDRENSQSTNGWDTVRLKREINEKARQQVELESSLQVSQQREQSLMQNNRLLSQQLFELKKQQIRSDTAHDSKEKDELLAKVSSLEIQNAALSKELTNTRNALQEAGRLTPRRESDSDGVRQLERENMRLRQTLESISAGKWSNLPTAASNSKTPDTKQDISFRAEDESQRLTDIHVKDFGETTDLSALAGRSALHSKRQDRQLGGSVDIDDVLLSEEGIMGVVSLEEMVKLELRVREFGDCNLELEDLIYRLKSKMTGTDLDGTRANKLEIIPDSPENSAPNQISEKQRDELHEIKHMLTELKMKIEFAEHQKSSLHPNPKSSCQGNCMNLVELLMEQTRRHASAEVRFHQASQNLKLTQQELLELKDEHRTLQIQFNTLSAANLQQESQIETLLAQHQDQKNQLVSIFSEQEHLRQNTQTIFSQLQSEVRKRHTESKVSA